MEYVPRKTGNMEYVPRKTGNMEYVPIGKLGTWNCAALSNFFLANILWKDKDLRSFKLEIDS